MKVLFSLTTVAPKVKVWLSRLEEERGVGQEGAAGADADGTVQQVH